MFKRNHGYYKCKICHERFKIKKEDKYEAVKLPSGGAFGPSFSNSVSYDAFDCPYCGCQNLVNEREPCISVLEPVEKVFEDKNEYRR